jgi:hypothetical protein
MGAGGAVAAYHIFPYVAKRIELLKNPWSDPLVFGYQIIQALIAIGSGGMFGMGLGLGYPRNIPLYHSRLYLRGDLRGLRAGVRAGDAGHLRIDPDAGRVCRDERAHSFHALVAFGVVSLLAVQTLVIVGGNIKLIPLTGVTLPSSARRKFHGQHDGRDGVAAGVSSLNAGDEAEDLKRLEWREGGI